MNSLGGPMVFTRGMLATVFRDSIFGLIFSLRRLVPADDGVARFAAGASSAAVATVCSSPFNYLRNLSYAQCPSKPMKRLSVFWRQSLADLGHQVKQQSGFVGKCRYLQMRLAV